jgi:acetyltransferase-like isoleucine patch superfamily enzyme
VTLIKHLIGTAIRWTYEAVYLRLRVEWDLRVFGLWHAAQLAGRVPPQYVPVVLRRLGASIGARPVFKPGLRIENATGSLANLKIGDNCHIGSDVLLDVTGPIEIGNDVAIASQAALITHLSTGGRPLKAFYADQVRGVRLSDGAMIGTGAIVLCGVHVARCAWIGAGALVSRDVPPYTVMVGNPARPVKKLRPTGPDAAAALCDSPLPTPPAGTVS